MIAAIVLAAGLSRRMGRPKLLLEIDGKPLVRWAVEGVAPHVGDVIVVVPPEAEGIRAALEGLDVRYAVNPRPEDGQGTSIAAGVRALGTETRAVLVVLGDQPHLDPAIVPALLRVFAQSRTSIVAPRYRDVQGNPVLFAAAVFPELARLSGDAGARSVVRRDPARVEIVEFDTPVPADVDTPDDYRRLSAG
jgi:molybdenum cofactor cytidylyltransferase